MSQRKGVGRTLFSRAVPVPSIPILNVYIFFVWSLLSIMTPWSLWPFFYINKIDNEGGEVLKEHEPFPEEQETLYCISSEISVGG